MFSTINSAERKLLYITGTAWLFDAMDIGLLSFIMAALKAEWNLTAQQLGWIGSTNSIGMAVGAVLFGIYADRYGRKSALLASLFLFSVASGLSALMTGLTGILILRFFIGCGLGGELPVASTLVSESVPPTKRGRIIVLLESFWAVGWLAAAIIAYFLMPFIGWQGALLLCALPAFYCIFLRQNLPEASLYQTNQAKLSLVKKIQQLVAKDYYRASLMLWLTWFCVVLSYYGMFLWLPSVMVNKGHSLINSFGYILIMTLAQLPGYFVAAYFIEIIGRKLVLIIFLTGTLISAYCFGQANSLSWLLVFGSLLAFFNLGAWGALYAYTPEQYPTSIRATGSGIAAGVGRIGGIFGPLFVGYAVTAGYSTGFIFAFFAAIILCAVVAILFLGKETKQLQLTS